MPNSFFEYVDPSSTAADPSGLWTRRAPAVSFEAGAAAVDETPVWRVNLSGDPRASEQSFRQAEAQMAAAQRALASVPGRLDEFVRRSAGRGEGQVSFAVGEVGTPEAELTSLLGEYRALESGQVSFGVREEASQAWDQANAQFKELMNSINREVLHFAWVETCVDGDPIARTTVGWGGDSQTLYSADISDVQVGQHSQTLHLASASRSLKLRMFTTIATGAAKLTALLASGSGAVLALPLAYQYVSKILAQVKEYRALQPSL